MSSPSDSSPVASQLIAYANRLSVEPGQSLDVKVSSTTQLYEARVVRLVHGDENPAGPGFIEHEVDRIPSTTHHGRVQATYSGSYVLAPAVPELDRISSLTFSSWILPTFFSGEPHRTVMSKWDDSISAGLRLLLLADGRVAVEVGRRDDSALRLQSDISLNPCEWYFVAGGCDLGSRLVRLIVRPLVPRPDFEHLAVSQSPLQGSPVLSHGEPFTVGATLFSGSQQPHACFNGKIEAPRAFRGLLSPEECDRVATGHQLPELILSWDFSHDQDSAQAKDLSGAAYDGRVINSPDFEAVTGHLWTGRTVRFTDAPEEYAGNSFP